MSVDVKQIIERGGRPRIDLLEFCVISRNMDAVFLVLVPEFRIQPTTPKAESLYELFCAPDAPARIGLTTELPPKDLRLPRALQPYLDARRTPAALSSDELAEDAPDNRPSRRMLLPPKYLFDLVATALETAGEDPLARLGRQYNPVLSPMENLPGGTMTSAQKFFVDFVWTPRVRPGLVSAGFRRFANIA